MTDEEMALYDAAMKSGKYLEGAAIALAAATREREREREESQRESREFWAAWQKRKAGRASHSETVHSGARRVDDEWRGRAGSMTYSHRNGETEPPTERGWYWFNGTISFDGMMPLGWSGLVVLVMEGSAMQPHVQHAILADVALSKTNGRWSGPVVPPWDEDGA